MILDRAGTAIAVTAFGLVALFPLGTAFTFAFYMLITRQMSRSLHPVTMQLHTALAGSVLCLPLVWAFDGTGIKELDSIWPKPAAPGVPSKAGPEATVSPQLAPPFCCSESTPLKFAIAI